MRQQKCSNCLTRDQENDESTQVLERGNLLARLIHCKH